MSLCEVKNNTRVWTCFVFSCHLWLIRLSALTVIRPSWVWFSVMMNNSERDTKTERDMTRRRDREMERERGLEKSFSRSLGIRSNLHHFVSLGTEGKMNCTAVSIAPAITCQSEEQCDSGKSTALTRLIFHVAAESFSSLNLLSLLIFNYPDLKTCI